MWPLLVIGLTVAATPIVLMLILCAIVDIGDMLEPLVDRLLKGTILGAVTLTCLWVGAFFVIVAVLGEILEVNNVS